MRIYQILGHFVLLFVVGGIAFADDVEVKFEPDVDFSQLKTYGWMETAKRPDDHPLALGSPIDRTIRQAVETALGKRGLEKVETSPVVLITYHAALLDQLSVGDVPYRVSSRVSISYEGDLVQTRSFQEGTIVIDIVEASSNRLIWSGVGTHRFKNMANQPAIRRQAEKLVTKVLKKYPPKK